MHRATFILAGVILGLTTLFTAPAGAQDDAPMIELSGDDITVTEDGDETTYSVPTEGTYDVTVDASNFTVDVFVLQCPGAGGNLEALEEGDPTTLCDLGNLLPGSPADDGTFSVTFEGIEIDSCGLVFAAGDAAGTEGAAALLSVEEQDDTAVCAVTETAGYDEDLENTDDAEVAGVTQEAGEDGELATTGRSTLWTVTIGLLVATAGALILFEGRRIAHRFH